MGMNLIPGGNFSPTGTISTYANQIVAPAILAGPPNAATRRVIMIVWPGPGRAALQTAIIRLVPFPS
jgi:hypothetical protein